MLSYRHSFHAGNHADVLKHVVLTELLRYLTIKPKPLCYIDTHAGAGQYRIGREVVAAGEAESGIGRLWGRSDLPDVVERYVGCVRRSNPDGELRHYPGSPAIAAMQLRREDRLWLSELHPADYETLTAAFRDDRRVRTEQRDGLAWLSALLPPASRRGLVIIDPSYEVKTEYERVSAALSAARARFDSGVYAVWYPVLPARAAVTFPEDLARSAGPKWLDARLLVRDPRDPGLAGSGMFVVNPPYRLAETLAAVLPWLTEVLGQHPRATHRLTGGAG